MAELLPPNATTLERQLAAVTARLDNLATPLRDLVNPSTCPAALLPWLASALSVDSWSDSWTEAQKRAVIAAWYQVHRKKGTLSSVRAALQALGVRAGIIEWWQDAPRSVPHTFRVDVDTEDVGMSRNLYDSIEQQLVSVKPVRSHFTVRLIATARPSIFMGTVCHDAVITTIYPQIT